MKEKKLRMMSSITKYLAQNNAKEHFMCIDKKDNKLHVVITRNNKLIVNQRFCKLGGSGNHGGISLEEAQQILDFINQE